MRRCWARTTAAWFTSWPALWPPWAHPALAFAQTVGPRSGTLPGYDPEVAAGGVKPVLSRTKEIPRCDGNDAA